jgi:hypothetical protein
MGADPAFVASQSSQEVVSTKGFNPGELLPGDIVQITNEGHHWFPSLIVVSELKSFGIQGFCFMPHNDGSGTGEAYIRLRREEYERVGVAVIMSESTALARQSTGEHQ